MDVSVFDSFSFHPNFVQLGFIDKVFNKIVLTNFFKFHNNHSRGSIIRKNVNDNQFTK